MHVNVLSEETRAAAAAKNSHTLSLPQRQTQLLGINAGGGNGELAMPGVAGARYLLASDNSADIVGYVPKYISAWMMPRHYHTLPSFPGPSSPIKMLIAHADNFASKLILYDAVRLYRNIVKAVLQARRKVRVQLQQ